MIVQIKDITQIIADVSELMRGAYGPDINLDPNTQDGQLVALFSNAILQLYQLLLAVYTASKVSDAQKEQLIDLVELVGVFAAPGTQTVVPGVALTGVAGTLIPLGSQASTSSGLVFYSGSDVTLDVSGNGSVDFFAGTLGSPVLGQSVVAIGQLNNITTPIAGWSTVINPNAGIQGLNGDTDYTLRKKQQNLIGQFSLGYVGAIKAKVKQQSTVKDAFIYQNDTTSTAPAPISSPRNSITAIIYYTDASQEQQIANALFVAKGAPSLYSIPGPTQVTKIVNDISGVPHDVSWNKAIEVPIYITMIANQSVNSSIDAVATIKQNLLDYMADPSNVGISSTVYFSKLLGQIADIDPSIIITEFFLGKTPSPTTTADLTFAYNEVATLLSSNIIITIDSALSKKNDTD